MMGQGIYFGPPPWHDPKKKDHEVSETSYSAVNSLIGETSKNGWLIAPNGRSQLQRLLALPVRDAHKYFSTILYPHLENAISFRLTEYLVKTIVPPRHPTETVYLDKLRIEVLLETRTPRKFLWWSRSPKVKISWIALFTCYLPDLAIDNATMRAEFALKLADLFVAAIQYAPIPLVQTDPHEEVHARQVLVKDPRVPLTGGELALLREDPPPPASVFASGAMMPPPPGGYAEHHGRRR